MLGYDGGESLERVHCSGIMSFDLFCPGFFYTAGGFASVITNIVWGIALCRVLLLKIIPHTKKHIFKHLTSQFVFIFGRITKNPLSITRAPPWPNW